MYNVLYVGTWLTRHGWLVAIAVAYLYVFPYYPRLHSANELPRVYLVQAMVDDDTFAIDRGVARWGATADVSPSNGHLYSNKAPGSSLLAAPAYAAARLVTAPDIGFVLWLCRIVTGVIPTLIALAMLRRFLERYADPTSCTVVVVAYALGSMAMTYSILYIAHQLAAVCLLISWILAWDHAERRRGVIALWGAGLLAGCAPLVDYQAAFAVPPLLVATAVKLRDRSAREWVIALSGAALAAVVPVGALLAYHAVCFGSPFRTGYDASTTFAHFHQHGFLGLTRPMWPAFMGSMLSPDNGLFVLMPWLVLAFPGGIVLWRRGERVLPLTGAAIAAIFIAFVSSVLFWRGGWSVGPRYVTEMLPFWLPFVAAQLAAWRPYPLRFAIATGVIGASVIIFTLSSATFPYWPDDIRNPVWEIAIPLVRDGAVALTPLSAFGVTSPLTLLPYAAVVSWVTAWAIARASNWRIAVVAAAIACAVVIAYREFPSTPHIASLYEHQVLSFVR